MSERTLKSQILGRDVEFSYSESAIAYALFFLRIVMGWTFFQGGITKVLASDGWSAAGFLVNAIPEGNPFVGMFAAMAGNPVIDALNMWGLTLVGLSLLLGAFVRWSAFWGAIMMIFYWMASLQGGLLAGFPLENGWVVDDHIVYAVLLYGLGAFGAGRILGLDALIEKFEYVKQHPRLSYILG